MPERFEGLLPVGSVVRLQGSDAQVMVLGFEPQLGDVQADYLGVAYPMGLVSDDAALAFDASEIAEVVFAGYWDAEGDAALAAVQRFHDAADDVRRQFEELVASLTVERLAELRDDYVFDAMDEEPEPDFPEEEDELNWLPDEVCDLVDGPAEH